MAFGSALCKIGLVLLVCCSRYITKGEAGDVRFKVCSDGESGSVTKLNIEPCAQQPCKFHLGTNVTVRITIVPRELITHGSLVIYALLGPETKFFPFLKFPDVCEHHRVKCPLKERNEYTVEIDLELKEWYPTSHACVAQFELRDQSGEVVFCIKFPLAILP